MSLDNLKKIGNVTINSSYYHGRDLYNEGDDVEELVLKCFKNGENPEDILADDSRWPVLYQLFDRREMIVEPMNIDKTCNVLEIGSGMGAVTGAIAKKAVSVDCVDLSMRRSLANAYRNREYDNISIYVGNFQDIVFNRVYEVVTLIGVFEYAQFYIDGEDPYINFLKRISGFMTHNARLYVAIENKIGMKYFAGCSEDHLCEPFRGIEGYNISDRARTFTKSQLTNLLISAGFRDIYFYYPYPDYKLPTAIYSDDYLPNSSCSFHIANFDYDRLLCFDEQKAYGSIISNVVPGNEMKILSNSFLVEAVWR